MNLRLKSNYQSAWLNNSSPPHQTRFLLTVTIYKANR